MLSEVLLRSSYAGKPGSDAAHYHQLQEEHIEIKEGKLGYYIGHQTHVKTATAGEEVTIKPGELRHHTLSYSGAETCCLLAPESRLIDCLCISARGVLNV